MAELINLNGERFGRLTVISRSGSDRRGEALWVCKCDCGERAIIRGNKLRTGHTKSCGCLSKEVSGKTHRKHGMEGTRLYNIWINMKSRCKYEGNLEFKDYGGRGITFCKEWESFEPFMKWALENGYECTLSIDRIDNERNYEPSNCRWSDACTQQNNKRNNHRLTVDGETHTIGEWATITGIKYDTIERRINAYGWKEKEAVSIPPRGRRW